MQPLAVGTGSKNGSLLELHLAHCCLLPYDLVITPLSSASGSLVAALECHGEGKKTSVILKSVSRTQAFDDELPYAS